MKLDIGYVDSWQIRDKKDVHLSHCTAIIEVENLWDWLELVYPYLLPTRKPRSWDWMKGYHAGQESMKKMLFTELKGEKK